MKCLSQPQGLLMKNELILSGSHLITYEAKSFCAKLKKQTKQDNLRRVRARTAANNQLPAPAGSNGVTATTSTLTLICVKTGKQGTHFFKD